VQIHASGNCLLGGFLAPKLNARTDEFGGDARRRAEFTRRVVVAVRAAVPVAYPVMVKIFGAGLMKPEDAARIFAGAGADNIEVSMGMLRPNDPQNTRGAALVRAHAPSIALCGRFVGFKEMEEALASGLTDYISLGRPLIRQPDLVKRFREGELTRAACDSCNGCVR